MKMIIKHKIRQIMVAILMKIHFLNKLIKFKKQIVKIKRRLDYLKIDMFCDKFEQYKKKSATIK